MKPILRSALALAAGGALMLLLDAVSKRRVGGRSRIIEALLARLRPAPVADDTVATRVRYRLARTATNPDAITVSIEHGCADLRGAVPTRERSRIVRAIASLPGVDSVVDLMTERPARRLPAPAAIARPPSRRAASGWLRRVEWSPVGRALALGGGLGITMAGLRSGGLIAVAAATVGLLLIACGATATSPRPGEQREAHQRF